MKEKTFTRKQRALSGRSANGWMRSFMLCLLCMCVSYLSAQESAETALDLVIGENTYSFENADGLNTVYYVYTAPEDESKLLEIQLENSSASATVSTDGTTMNTVSGCVLNGGMRRIYPVEAGQKVYLIMSVNQVAELTFTASVSACDLTLGESCDAPIVASEDTFFIKQPSSYGAPVYVSYTCPEDGVVEMHFTGYVYGQIQEGCDGTGTSMNVSYNNGEYVGKFTAKKDVTYILAMQLYSPILGQFILTHPEEGSSCDAPFELVEGENTLPKDAGIYWYRFQASKNGFLLLTSEAGLQGGSITVQTSCESYSQVASIAGFFDLRCGINEGTVYIVRIEKIENTDEDVVFHMEMEDPKAGDSFANPLDITTEMKGTVPQYDGTYYYRVTVPEGDARFLIVDATEAALSGAMTMVTVIPADNEYSQLGSAKDYVKVIAEGSKQYIIKWVAGESLNTPFDFTVSFEEIEKGDVCQNPLEAVLGNNVLPEGEVKYFSYVPTQACWLQVSSDMPLNVVFPMSCDVYSGTYPVTTSGFTYKIEVTPDKEYILKFTDVAFEQSFELSEVEYRKGETCDMPFEAVIGDNEIPNDMLKSWFRIIPEQEGMLEITTDMAFETTSTGSSQVVVYLDGCQSSGNTIVKTDANGNTWFEGAFVVGPENVVLINVRAVLPQTDKSLTLGMRDLQPGEACSNPIRIESTGELTLPIATKNNPVWYELNLDPCKLRIYDDAYFSMSLYESCEATTSLASSNYMYDYETGLGQYVLEYDIQNAGKYLLKLDGCSNEITVTIEGSISVGLQDETLSGVTVIGTEGGILVNSVNPELVMIYDLTGRLVASSQNVTNASYTLPEGLYLVRIGSTVRKVVVE